MPELSCRSVLTGVAISPAVCGCASETDTQHPGNSDIDGINQGIQQIMSEQTWLEAVRACPINTRPQVIDCFGQGYQSSQFLSTVGRLPIQLEHVRDRVDNGDSKVALSAFVTKLHLLSQMLDTLRRLRNTGTVPDLKAAGYAAQGAWVASVQAEETTRKAC